MRDDEKVKKLRITKLFSRKNHNGKSFESIWSEYTDAHDSLRKILTPNTVSRWGEISIQKLDSPWKGFPSPDSEVRFPNMLSDEEISYLSWLGSDFIRENDIVVEIGPWLGKSSRLLTHGKNSRRTIITIDDFIWRSIWMDSYVSKNNRKKNHESFLELFKTLNADYLPYFNILQRRLNIYDGNDQIKKLSREDLPSNIDILFIDCGRTIEVNETWWGILEPLLISGESLIVMQDWRLWRESPQKSYNQTLFFTETHKENLRLIHEVTEGGLAAFLYV
jgi:predicted O-methyltransferase YrrM